MSLRKFESLTPAGKRCRIARDVLMHLNTEQLQAKHDYYINTAEFEEKYLNFTERNSTALSDWIKTGKRCKVCALGAILACKVTYENGITLAQAESHSNLVDNLLPYFSLLQLNMIELAFEGHCSGMKKVDEEFMAQKGAILAHRNAAGYRDLTPDAILRDIMHNIIAHKGTFIPTGKPTPAPARGKNQHSKKAEQKPQWTLQSWAAEVDRRNAAGVELTHQEMFDRAWIGLKLQGFQQCTSDGVSCLYKKDDNHCAWGWVDPEGTSDQSRAYGSVYNLKAVGVGVARHLRGGWGSGLQGFALELQKAHDRPWASVIPQVAQDNSPAAIENALRQLAQRYNLTILED